MGIRTRIFLLIFLSLSISITISYIIAERDLTNTFEEQILDQLEKQASLLVEYIDEVDSLQENNNADSIADRLGNASNSRVTLILNNGKVIGDSYIDENKIGLIGGSYGGYMTMAAMTFTPNEFKVGVNIFGVTNWISTLKSIPIFWEASRKALYDELGDPFTIDSVRLKKISPLFHADEVKNPVLVLQGANDPRVLQIESDEIVEELNKNNIPVEYIVFDDEGHGFRKKENQIKKIKEECDLPITNEEFDELLSRCHSEDYQFLLIDFASKCKTKMFRKGWNEYLIPPSLEGKCQCNKKK